MIDIAMTVLAFGAGQDTVYLLNRMLRNKKFMERHVKGHFIVVGSDVGVEHPHTYEAVEYCRAECQKRGIPFYWVTPNMGFHSESWQSLTHQYKKNRSIGSAAFRQTCTDNLKVKVMDRFTEWYIKEHFGCVGERKRAYHDFYEKYGKIRLILGFAAGEEKRTEGADKFDAVWKKLVQERYYPLIEDNTTRFRCIEWNSLNIPMKIWPSNCMICFYQSDQEILWLWRNYPEVFIEWEEMEAEKLKKCDGIEKNYGVYGKITLRQKLEKAEKLYGHWTKEELDEYKFSHGHCLQSKM